VILIHLDSWSEPNLHELPIFLEFFRFVSHIYMLTLWKFSLSMNWIKFYQLKREKRPFAALPTEGRLVVVGPGNRPESPPRLYYFTSSYGASCPLKNTLQLWLMHISFLLEAQCLRRFLKTIHTFGTCASYCAGARSSVQLILTEGKWYRRRMYSCVTMTNIVHKILCTHTYKIVPKVRTTMCAQSNVWFHFKLKFVQICTGICTIIL
jgi:hypothetical protein